MKPAAGMCTSESSSQLLLIGLCRSAGGIGLVANPAQGAWKSMQKTWSGDKQATTLTTRREEGVEAVKKGTAAERNKVLEAFAVAVKNKEQRKKALSEAAVEALKEPELLPDTASRSSTIDSAASTSSPAPPTPTSLSPRPSSDSTPVQGNGEEEDEAAFQRDLELAKQISLAEQRGYERGLASAGDS